MCVQIFYFVIITLSSLVHQMHKEVEKWSHLNFYLEYIASCQTYFFMELNNLLVKYLQDEYLKPI